ncbi:outer membrane lipoprotein carrier protein LolA [Treponema sp.]|uniref:LolA family protein n=1 Tax=Treponema sp. TaxID=166 RepID=UPI0025EB192B|nr:outer membrane lipoprotein carrier protein LolA [Treponema sp.]MCR5218060.1 outer membrane lipoprotein carrier protein LolA [Treponema sp.]
MKSFIKHALCLLILGVSATVFAQEKPLDKILTSITSHKITTGDFNQEKYSSALKKPLKSSGTFIFSQDKILWRTLKPMKTSMAVTPEYIIQTAASGKRSVIESSSSELFGTVASAMTSIFSGDSSLVENYFNVSVSEGKEWVVTLEPKDATISSSLKQIIIEGDYAGTKAQLKTLVIKQSDTDYTKYNLKNIKYKETLSNEDQAYFIK